MSQIWLFFSATLSACTVNMSISQPLSLPDEINLCAERDIKTGTFLQPKYFVFNNGSFFIDKKLPVKLTFMRKTE